MFMLLSVTNRASQETRDCDRETTTSDPKQRLRVPRTRALPSVLCITAWHLRPANWVIAVTALGSQLYPEETSLSP